MSRWSKKTDEEKAQAEANRKKYSRSHEELVKDLHQKSYELVIENGDIPMMCTKVRLYSGCISYTIEERTSFISNTPIPMYVGICRGCKGEHMRPLIGEPIESALLAHIAFNLIQAGRLVDKRRMKDEPSQARKETR